MVRRYKENHGPTQGRMLKKAGAGLCVKDTLDNGLRKKYMLTNHLYVMSVLFLAKRRL